MMGRSHALSGGVSWLAGCALLETVGARPSAVVIWAGAAVAAGMALLPDLDHPGSTVSRTLGPATRLVSWTTANAAAAVRSKSCTHCSGRPDSGHRGVTHTLAGAVVAGIMAAAAGVWSGRAAALVVVGLSVWLAAHTALSSVLRAKVGDMVLPGRFRRRGRAAHRFAAAVGAVLLGVFAAALLSGAVISSWWWIGVPVFWGCLAHACGDALTYSRVPLLWPLKIGGCRWALVGSPRWLRFRTGSAAETVVVVLLALSGAGALAVLGGAG